MTVPSSGTSIGTSRCTANAGTFSNVTCLTLPASTLASTAIRPAGVSSLSRVTGSSASTIPVSMSAVTTQMVLVPDIGGYSTCSMMTKPASASGWVGGRTRLDKFMTLHSIVFQPSALIWLELEISPCSPLGDTAC